MLYIYSVHAVIWAYIRKDNLVSLEGAYFRGAYIREGLYLGFYGGLLTVVAVVTCFILSRLLYLAFSTTLGLLCMPHLGMGPLV